MGASVCFLVGGHQCISILYLVLIAARCILILFFSVLCRARHGYKLQLSVLEAVCQRIHKPNLCVQKDSIIRLKLF